ncbi:hypothetical protein EH196_00650 [Bacillus sp. C1-1]|nr:hypothetical protein EH196_00650 [Bacillus sp. C1-1]
MKSREHKIILINAIPSFIIAFAVSMLLASGTIAENDTDHAFVFPQAFIILVTWFLGLLIGLLTRRIVVSVPIMYLSFVTIYIYLLFVS